MQQNPLSLDEVKSHFDQWRATRTKRGKIPKHLWYLVKQIITRYSLTKITKQLSINTNQIRSNLGIAADMNFIEVSTHALLTSPSPPPLLSAIDNDVQTYSIELHRSNGSILKIGALSADSLRAIITQFIG